MESDGTRTDSLPPKPRRKVLRKGVRIVAEQFAPYSDEPDELPVLQGIRAFIAQVGRAYGKQYQLYTQRMKYVTGDFNGQSVWLQFIDEATSKPLDLPQRRQYRNDGKQKKTRQEEPFYVRQEKKKKRR